MTPDQIFARIQELEERFGSLPYGEQLIVDGRRIDVRRPEFLTDFDTLTIFPFGVGCSGSESVSLDAEITATK